MFTPEYALLTDIGMNLTGAAYWLSQFAFIDRFKTSATWVAVDGNFAHMAQAVPVDANGFPTALPIGAAYITTPVSVDPVSAGTSDLYELTYSGTATFTLNATVVSTAPGKIVFRYDGDSPFTQVSITSIDPANPVTAIHVVRQDQVGLYDQGELFNPEFVDKVSHWDTLRFKDWGIVDNSTISTWSQRSTLDSASWSGNNSTSGGVPLEAMVALANEAHTNMWLSIPAHATDDYVRQALIYVRDHLDPALKVQVEYSNEVWNWDYEQAHYALTMGDALWGKDANHDGVIDPNDPKEHVSDGYMQYYGYRSAQIAAIAETIFGQGDRLSDVLATQTLNTGLEGSILKGVAKAGLGSTAALFENYAVTTYFGSEFDGSTAADRSQVLAWARDGSAGVDAAFQELEFGGKLSGHDSLADLAAVYAYQAKVAHKNGMTLVAYEGGVHLTAWQYDADVRDEVISFFQKLTSDPRMATLYSKMVAEFTAAGGTELTALTDIGVATQWGDFGVLSSIYDDSSPRYDALTAAAAADPTTKIDPTLAATSDGMVNTSLAAATLDIYGQSLTFTGKGAFTGTGNLFDNVITGGSSSNTLYGLGGDDTLNGGRSADYLDGGIGADRMRGGKGNDVYIVDNVGDVVMESLNSGVDEVRTTLAAYMLPHDVENLTFIGAGAFVGTGNAAANIITGGAGDDILDGGGGADTLIGGSGNDVYYVDNAGDRIVEAPGGGIDEVRTTFANFTLADGLENLTYLGAGNFTGTGNAADNVITGGAGNDILDGGLGADRLIGGAGNDLYYVDNPSDVVVEYVGGGTDEVRTALPSYILGANVENLTFTGTGSFSAFGNAGDNVITGSGTAPDILSGGDGNDRLIGGSANDTFYGGSGIDTMIGGAGDDAYIVDDARAIVVENANGGTDRILSSVTYTLPANVENLSLTGSAAIDGTGNALSNYISGNDAANALTGGGGDDVIVGQGGDDRLTGNSGNDVLIGGDGDDMLIGGAGDDSMNGGAGHDRLVGGAGKDTMNGGSGADVFAFTQDDVGPAAVAAPDLIGDFSHADGDVIDLQQIDAIIGTATDDAFTFIGDHPFSRHAGELRVSGGFGVYDVSGDINGDGVADFHLLVYAALPLVAGDFRL